MTSVVFGDVAQLGERLVRNEEAVGSTPIISTSFSPVFYAPSLQIFSVFKISVIFSGILIFNYN